MSLKTGIITALSALGLFATTAAHAQTYYPTRTPTTIARPVRYQRQSSRYNWTWYRGRYVRRPTYVQPVYQQPVYQQPVYQQPVYQQPVYNQPVYDQPVYNQPVYNQPVYNNGCNAFAEQVRAELANIEAAVRARVQTGELDGNALTTMEAARDDMQQDLVDLSAKGYVTDADRAHIEHDIQLLRSKFGC